MSVRVLLGLALAAAGATAPAADPPVVPDRFDVVFYARSRPVRLRAVVAAHGQSLAGRWDAHQQKLFAAFDRDRDGALNGRELEQVFPIAGIRMMFQGDFYTRANGPPPELNQVDQDGDARVSPAEFAAYYRPVWPELIQPRSGGRTNSAQDAATTALFSRLDENGDGKLARTELQAAEQILLGLDADEDECVTQSELLATRSRDRVEPPPQAAMKTGRPAKGLPSRPDGPLDVAIFEAGSPPEVVKEVLRRYDGDKDGKLTPAESGFDRANFERLDRDSSGALTAAELDAWRTGEPDGTVVLTFAAAAADCKVTATPRGGGWPAGWAVRQTEPGRLVVRVGPQTIDFTAPPPPKRDRNQRFQAMFGDAFSADKKFIVDGDLVGPQNQFLRVIFEAADFDADGKLTREEFRRYTDLQQETTELGLVLVHVTRTPNLFQMFDDNVDGKLGVRELRTAWDRLVVLEPAGADAVTRGVLQPSVSIRLTPAVFASYDPVTARQSGVQPTAPRGPLWFLKMDRNADGDVSRAEFLGGPAEFALLDVNRDGLIALAEAAAYEKTARPPKPGAARSKKRYPWFTP